MSRDVPVVVFFDLDRTLIPFNSAFLFARDEWRAQRLPTARLLESAVWMSLYHLSLVDMEVALTRAAEFYRGVPEEHIRQATEAWFETRVRHALLPLGRAALDRHRAAGHRLVLHTSSSPWLAAAAAAAWGLDDWIANIFATNEAGQLTGAIVRPVCFGRGKLTLARRYVERIGANLEDAWFYTDSATDAPLLHAVGNPRVVQPDPWLARLAATHGWPRVDWRGPCEKTDHKPILSNTISSE